MTVYVVIDENGEIDKIFLNESNAIKYTNKLMDKGIYREIISREVED